jgi:hypothetical protein
MRAILEEDIATAETLEKKLVDIQKKNAQIAADLAIIAATKDPFATWAGSLSQALVQLAQYGKSMADINATTFIPGVNFNPAQNADRNYDAAVAAVVATTNTAAAAAAAATPTNTKPIPVLVKPTPTPVTNNPFAGLGGPTGAGITFNPSQNPDRNYDARLQAPTVIVNNNGSVIMQEEFVAAVNEAVVTANRQGLVVTVPGGIRSDEG